MLKGYHFVAGRAIGLVAPNVNITGQWETRLARLPLVPGMLWCTPSMGVNLWGESPLWEVSIGNHEPKATAEGQPSVGRKLEARPARPRTETAYKAQLWGESAQHDEALLTRGRVNAGFARGRFTHLIWGDLSGIGWGRTLA
jgi:hypothetical protein